MKNGRREGVSLYIRKMRSDEIVIGRLLLNHTASQKSVNHRRVIARPEHVMIKPDRT